MMLPTLRLLVVYTKKNLPNKKKITYPSCTQVINQTDVDRNIWSNFDRLGIVKKLPPVKGST